MNNKNDKNDKKSVWTTLLEHSTLVGIAAVITAIGTVLAIVVPPIVARWQPTPTPAVSPIATQTPVSPSPTRTHSPSPTATTTSTPTLTPSPSPTATPTPSPIPPHAQFDEFDDFTGMILDPSKWRIEGGTTPLLTDGSLFLNVGSGDAWADAVVYARLDDREARVVAAEVVVLKGTSPGQAGIIAGPVAQDANRYVNFGILYRGDIYLQEGIVGDPEPQWLGFWPRPAGEPHVLRIEWTGRDVWFEADGERLQGLKTDEPLRWFALLAGARDLGYIEDRFNWVGWNWHP